MLTPLLYYLVEHKSVGDYFFNTYKQLRDMFNKLTLKLVDEREKNREKLNIEADKLYELS